MGSCKSKYLVGGHRGTTPLMSACEAGVQGVGGAVLLPPRSTHALRPCAAHSRPPSPSSLPHEKRVCRSLCTPLGSSICPLSLGTLVHMILRTARIQPRGVFNLGAADGMSKADFAFAFAAALGVQQPAMKRTSSRVFRPLSAVRPLDMRMNSRRIEAALGVCMPRLQQEIESTAIEYRDGY